MENSLLVPQRLNTALLYYLVHFYMIYPKEMKHISTQKKYMNAHNSLFLLAKKINPNIHQPNG